MTRLPSLSTLRAMPWPNALSILAAHEREICRHYPDDAGVTYGRGGRANGRRLEKRKLERVLAFKRELGLD